MSRGGNEALLAIAVFGILALMVVPLPSPALDLMLALSLTLGIVILLLALFSESPLDFSVFPSLLLVVTLLRLGLNVASTRLILLHGADGSDAAGHIIEAFGAISVGGNFAVGIVVFLIFVLINFMVISKGAGRIAEVAARFTLDAMPGKQMAIDADLNQGVIDDREARRRRDDIQREADFYGAMDGASKFVKGDAIAGILILVVNVVGGLFIGVVQEGLPLFEALQTYTILTVGDGLVAQVPALVVSTSAGVVVSRAASGEALADEIRTQILFKPRVLGVASVMLGSLAFVPGMPFAPFAVLAAGAGLLARFGGPPEVEETPEVTDAPPAPDPAQDMESALVLDELELEIGYGLIPLVDPDKGGELLHRIRATRRQLASDLGFVVPSVHIRDNLQLESGCYRVLLRGNPVAQAAISPGRWLALKSGDDLPKIPGVQTRDPAFGLPAVWIQERDRERASAAGYAVVDAATAVATHLSEVIRTHAADLLSRQQVRELLDQLTARSPKVVEEIVPAIVALSTLHRTLRTLLLERVSIRDLETILETLAEYAPKVQDPDMLVDLVRERLGRTVTRPYVGGDGRLPVITLAPDLEERLRGAVHRTDSGSFLSVDPATLDGLVKGLERAVASVGSGSEGSGPVLLASQQIRSPLRQIVARVVPRLAVISHNELPPEVKIVARTTVEAHAH